MNVTLHNFEELNDNVAHLSATLTRLAQHQHVKSAAVHITTRDKNGWLEFITVVEYDTGGRFTFASIQRTPGAEVEFHS
jgi:hypothetical protein